MENVSEYIPFHFEIAVFREIIRFMVLVHPLIAGEGGGKSQRKRNKSFYNM